MTDSIILTVPTLMPIYQPGNILAMRLFIVHSPFSLPSYFISLNELKLALMKLYANILCSDSVYSDQVTVVHLENVSSHETSQVQLPK